MTVLFKTSELTLISHPQYVNKLYENAKIGDHFQKISIRDELFNVIKPFKCVKSTDDGEIPAKRRKNSKTTDLHATTLAIKNKSEMFINTHSEYFNSDESKKLPNRDEILTKCLHNSFTFENIKTCNGGNSQSKPICVPFSKERLILPDNCRFFSGDVRSTLTNLAEEKYNFVVMDPPWWNKYIRRIKSKNINASYEMLSNEEIETLPVSELMSENGLLAVWCTNCKNHEDFVVHKLFPKWGIEYLATWFWLKITQSGIPICPFSGGTNKQPYERLILGRKIDKEKLETIQKPPDGHIFISVPSLLHSHKPPLNDILKEYIVTTLEKPSYLEIFARYLLPNTTSVGYEPLKWQNNSLYVIHNTCE